VTPRGLSYKVHREDVPLTLSLPDDFEYHRFSRMNFRYVCKKVPSYPKLHEVADTFIMKGINGTSIGNAFECHGRPVRENRATGKCISTEKAPIQVQLINKLRVLKCPYLKNYTSYESENVSKLIYFLILRLLVKSARRFDLPFLRYGNFVVKGQIVIFVMVKLGNFASRKNSLDPRF
jgi:hypothetical protein